MNDVEWKSLMQWSPERGRRALIDQYGNLVYAIVLNKLKHTSGREDIEDCVSDIFVEIFKGADEYDVSAGSLKGYISIIAKRTAIDTYRRLINYHGKHDSIDDENESITIIDDFSVEEDVEKKSLRELLWQKIRSLGEPDKTIIIDQFFYDKSIEEISQRVSMTTSAVYKRSMRARQNLKKLLVKEI